MKWSMNARTNSKNINFALNVSNILKIVINPSFAFYKALETQYPGKMPISIENVMFEGKTGY